MTQQLLGGHARFRKEHFPDLADHYHRLVAEGQRPHTLFIGCSDSRVVPTLLTDAGPGDLFVVRNVGALVPPYEDEAHHGVSSAIEFAVLVLGVQDIVVCGHSHCGAIRALYEPPQVDAPGVERWIRLAEPARLDGPVDDALLRRTERRSIAVQLDHLMSFSFVREAVETGRTRLHGWHYVIEEGALDILDVESGRFVRHDDG